MKPFVLVFKNEDEQALATAILHFAQKALSIHVGYNTSIFFYSEEELAAAVKALDKFNFNSNCKAPFRARTMMDTSNLPTFDDSGSIVMNDMEPPSQKFLDELIAYRYNELPAPDDHIVTVQDFHADVASSMFMDDDGHGHPMMDGKINPEIDIYPSRLEDIPPEATHIVWYNK